MGLGFGDVRRDRFVHGVMVALGDLMLSKCVCGWHGPTDTFVRAGIPHCPNCRRPFTQMRCEGCGE